MASEPERPLLDGVAQEREPNRGTRPAFWDGLAGVTNPAKVPANPCSDATWLHKGWGRSGEGGRGARRPPACVSARARPTLAPGSRERAGLRTFLARAQSWAPWRMLLRR